MSDQKVASKEKDLFLDKSAAKLDEEERKVKKIKDYMPEIQAALPDILAPLEKDPSSLDNVLTALYPWERKARLAADADSAKLVAETILESCFKAGNWDKLNNNIEYLVKCRAQLVKVIKAVVVSAMGFLATTEDKTIRRNLISALRVASEGKLFLEAEHADLTLQAAKMLEAEGDVAAAADLLQEVAAETIGAMELVERAAYLLEQLRMCLLKRDYVRAELVAKKIRTKQLLNKGWEEVRARYHRLMIRLQAHSSNWLECARAHLELYHCGRAQSDESPEAEAARRDDEAASMDANESPAALLVGSLAWERDLSSAVLFACLAPCDYDSKELLTRVAALPDLARMPPMLSLAQQWVAPQLVAWPLADAVDASLPQHTGLATQHPLLTAPVADEPADGTAAHRLALLRARANERNVSVLAQTHRTITLDSLALLLAITRDEAELCVCAVVAAGQLDARIDARTGFVHMGPRNDLRATRAKWTRAQSELLELVENTAQLVLNARA